MVRPQLSRCARELLGHARSFHSRPTPHESSIAYLLDRGPKDATNVVVNGFIRSVRKQKTMSFAAVGDGSSLEPLQALLTPQQADRSVLPPHFHMPEVKL